jgi:hypothetical protein
MSGSDIGVTLLPEAPSVEIPFFDDKDGSAALENALALAPSRPLVDVGGAPTAAATSATSVVLLYSKKSLVVLFEVFSNPPLRVEEVAGGPVFRDECVEVFLADPDDPVSYLELVVNPAGAVYGARVHNPNDSRATWTLETDRVPAGLDVTVAGAPAGVPPAAFARWTCRMRLPWTSLASGHAPLPGAVRRGNCYRIARGATTRFESLSPTGRSAPPDFHVPSRFARFVFGPAGR